MQGRTARPQDIGLSVRFRSQVPATMTFRWQGQGSESNGQAVTEHVLAPFRSF
jgi:hypothetical protein